MAYPQYPIVDVEVRSLRLDLSNFRFPGDQPTDVAAINCLFAEHGAMDVAQLILRDGYFDNELPIVVKEDGEIVVLEGNRRVAALRALREPSLVPSHELQLTRLLRKYDAEAAAVPTEIRVSCVPDRGSAMSALARLHIGQSKRRWSRDEQAKFVFAQFRDGVTVAELKEQMPAIKGIERLIRMGHVREMLKEVDLGDPSLQEYAASDELAMSSFEYAYRQPEVQAAIGLAFGDQHNMIARPSTPTHRAALRRLLRGFRANELNTRRGLKPGTPEYAKLLAEMQGDAGASAPPPRQADGDGLEQSPNVSPAPSAPTASGPSTSLPDRPFPQAGDGNRVSAKRGPNSPAAKPTLAITGIDEGALPLPLRYRIRELRRINVVEFPAAAVMLMRSVLEAVIKEHYGYKHGPLLAQSLGDVMKQVTSDYGKFGHVANAIGKINRTKKGKASAEPGTGEWFNLVTHSVNVEVSPADVHSAWKAVFPLVRYLLDTPAPSTPSP